MLRFLFAFFLCVCSTESTSHPLDFCNIFFLPKILGFHAIIRGSCTRPADVEKLPSGDCQTKESPLWCTTLQFSFTNLNNSLPKPPEYPVSLQFEKPQSTCTTPGERGTCAREYRWRAQVEEAGLESCLSDWLTAGRSVNHGSWLKS